MFFVILAPLALAAVAFAVRSGARRPLALLAGGLLHLAGVAAVWIARPAPALGGWLELDPLAKVVLPMTSVLFCVCAVYAQGYLARRADRDNRVFVGGLLVLLSSMTVVALSQHLGLMWVAMEAHHAGHRAAHLLQPQTRARWRRPGSTCSSARVGIALALLGSFFLAYSAHGRAGLDVAR